MYTLLYIIKERSKIYFEIEFSKALCSLVRILICCFAKSVKTQIRKANETILSLPKVFLPDDNLCTFAYVTISGATHNVTCILTHDIKRSKRWGI